MFLNYYYDYAKRAFLQWINIFFKGFIIFYYI